MPRWIVPATITCSGNYYVTADSAEEAVNKVNQDIYEEDPFSAFPSGGEVEVLEDCVEQLKEGPGNQELYGKIYRVLETNDAYCTDDEGDRMALAKALFDALREPPEKTARRCKECGNGRIIPTAKAGRTTPYRGRESMQIPADFEIPTCDNCGTEYFNDTTAEALDAVLDRMLEKKK